MSRIDDDSKRKTISDECLQDVKKFIILDVRAGFLNEQQIEEDIEYYLQYTWPYEPEVEKGAFQELVHELYEQYTSKGDSVYYKKLEQAFERLNRMGIVAEHLAGESMDEGFYNATEIARERYEEGEDIIGVCFYTNRSLIYLLEGITPVLYLSYGNCFKEPTAMEIGWMIVRELQQAGLEVKWNGQPEKKIGIYNLIWDKKYEKK